MSLQHVMEQVSDSLERIRGCFKPGVKITLLVRHTSDPEGRLDFMLTDDDPQQAHAMLNRRIAAGVTRAPV